MASKSTIIAISAVAAIAVGIVVVLMAIGFTPSSVPEQNGADAQSDNTTTAQTEISRSLTYLSTQTVLVPPNDDADAEALCQNRDVVLSGGYTIGVFNSTSLSNVSYDTAILYSNTAVRLVNATTIHEGWHAGLVNAGTGNLTITANAICLDVTSER